MPCALQLQDYVAERIGENASLLLLSAEVVPLPHLYIPAQQWVRPFLSRFSPAHLC